MAARARGQRAREAAVARDFGPEAARLLAEMRGLRNRVAHGPPVSVSPEQATCYARQALKFIGVLGMRQARFTDEE